MKKLVLLLLFIPLMSFNAVAQESTNTVSISELDEAPVYPRCKGDSNAEKRKCMSAKITQFIGRNFDKKIVDNLQTILAIELYTASQALSFSDKKSSPFLESIMSLFRQEVTIVEEDRVLHDDIVKSINFIKTLQAEDFRCDG